MRIEKKYEMLNRRCAALEEKNRALAAENEAMRAELQSMRDAQKFSMEMYDEAIKAKEEYDQNIEKIRKMRDDYKQATYRIRVMESEYMKRFNKVINEAKSGLNQI